MTSRRGSYAGRTNTSDILGNEEIMRKFIHSLFAGNKKSSSIPQSRQSPRTVAKPHRSKQSSPSPQDAGGRGVGTPKPQLDTISRPSGKGRMTGFEPHELRSYHPPVSICAKGVAGLGLFEADFSSKNVYSGQLGETGFYKALCRENLIDNFSSYWSVAMPASGGKPIPDQKFNTDVDCVIVQGATIFVIDLKYYASGAVTWYAENEWLLCRDDKTGQQVKDPRRMSRNMEMARSRFRELFPNAKIEPSVVLIPTNDGLGNVDAGTTFPGGVPLITLPDMIARLRSGAVAHAGPTIDEALTALLKD